MIKNAHQSSCKVPCILVRILMKRKFSRQILKKYSNVKFHENPSSGSWVIPCERTDWHVAFRNFANAPKNCLGKVLRPNTDQSSVGQKYYL